jgi:hypothetical protein
VNVFWARDREEIVKAMFLGKKEVEKVHNTLTESASSPLDIASASAVPSVGLVAD